MSNDSGKSAFAAVALVGKKATLNNNNKAKQGNNFTGQYQDAASQEVSQTIDDTKGIKQIQEETAQILHDIYQKSHDTNESNSTDIFNSVNIMQASFDKIQGSISELSDNIIEHRQQNRENINMILGVARDTASEISSACLDVSQKILSTSCPLNIMSNNMECVQKIQSACNNMVENVTKMSYDTMRNYMSLWFFGNK